MSVQDLPARYFDCMRRRDRDGLSALFSTDAIMMLPDGRELVGTAAIKAMYTQLFGAGAPVPTPTATVIGAQSVATEIEAQLPDGTRRNTANFFHCNADGLITHLSIYRRG